jgi:hypothetical protein
MKPNKPITHEIVKDLPKGFFITVHQPSRRMKAEMKRKEKISRRKQNQ